jgi:choline-sulfatase
MKPLFTRRDFLKLGSMLPLSLAARPLNGLLPASAPTGTGPNVLIVIFDALSALNVQMHGYGRETMPNLERLARRAIVYHQNYAGSNFTSPGTASLLTGTLPWTHRAFQASGRVAESRVPNNIFSVFPDYHRIAFTHNSWAMSLLNQFDAWIDEKVSRRTMYLDNYDAPIQELFQRDQDLVDVAWTRGMKVEEGYAYSLFLSRLYQRVREAAVAGMRRNFPRGLPMTSSKDAFLLEHAVDWLSSRLGQLPQPFFGYFHYLPPHAPYATSAEFYDRFAGDGLRIIAKPLSDFGDTRTEAEAVKARREYDEFLLYVDKAFASLYASLENGGYLENTWLVVTSDHGEMFERGLIGHGGPAMYEPVVRTPLIIFEPGRQERLDVHTPSSAVDLLSTLAQVTGHAIPSWAEGKVLPPFSEEAADDERPILSLQARKSRPDAPLTNATIALRRGRHKLIHYLGAGGGMPQSGVSLFDLVDDPEEMVDLSAGKPTMTAELLSEVQDRLERSNAALPG